MIDRKRTACFTGRRNIPTHHRQQLTELLDRMIEVLYHKGVVFYGAGGAYGFDNAMAIKNAKTITELVNRIIELEKLLIDIPPYYYADINPDIEKQRAERMKHKSFYGKLYDT